MTDPSPTTDPPAAPAAEPSSPTAPGGRWMPELMALLALGLGIVAVVRAWPELPATVPTHFGISGEPDASGARGTIAMLPAVAAFCYLLLSGVQRIPASWYNYPVTFTDENRARQHALARDLIVWLKVALMGLFSHLTIGILRIALGHAEELGPWVVWGWLAAIFALVGVYLVRARRAR